MQVAEWKKQLTPQEADALQFLHAFDKRLYDRISVEDRGYYSPCWMPDCKTDKHGYTYTKRGGKHRLTHRWVYQMIRGMDLWDGPVWDDKPTVADHLCREHGCTNPWHLEAVTQRVNMERGIRPALATHCGNGHAFTEANTRNNRDGSRTCRTCARVRARAVRATPEGRERDREIRRASQVRTRDIRSASERARRAAETPEQREARLVKHRATDRAYRERRKRAAQ